MHRSLGVMAGLAGVVVLGACGAPDQRALQTLACQQAANAIDLQSVSQLDTLRKALGLAPSVDPLGTCKALGVDLQPQNSAADSNAEGAKSESNGN